MHNVVVMEIANSDLAPQAKVGGFGVLYVLLAAVLVVVVLFSANRYGRDRAYAALQMRAQGNGELNAVLLRTVLEKQRSLPFVLAQDRGVISALSSHSDGMFKLI